MALGLLQFSKTAGVRVAPFYYFPIRSKIRRKEERQMAQ